MKKAQKNKSQRVYSTEIGQVCPNCNQPLDQCACGKDEVAPGDGIVRVRREVKGRKGKTVTTISGIPLAEDGLKELASDFKRRCGTGGSVKDGVIIIQGDHRDTLIPLLEDRGYSVKRAGG